MKRAFILTVLLALAAAAQQTPPPDRGVVFTSSARLVVETVTVLDKDGNPVEGLHPEDFTVTENGAPQQIKLFEFQKLDATPLAPMPAELPIPAPSTTTSRIAVKQEGGIQYRDRRLLALYFDLSNMGQAEQLRSLDAAQKFIQTGVTAADMVAILEFSSGTVNVRQDFTDNRSLLTAAIQKISS